MILLRSTHNSEIAALKAAFDAEKEELKSLYFTHIKTLESHIVDLKEMIFVPNRASQVPLVQQEQDAIMSVKEDMIEVDLEEVAKQDFILRERDRIFSGEFEDTQETIQ